MNERIRKMDTTSLVVEKDFRMPTKQIWIETIFITVITLLGMWFVPSAKLVFALLPVAYLLIERRVRQRTWGDLGFKPLTFWADLRANWGLFILMGFVMQPAIVFWARTYFPEFLVHVQARLPFESGIRWLTLLPLLAISLVGEEMTYRTLIQGRLTPFIGVPAAVGVASILFGLAHIAPGPGLIVLTDVGLIVVDSILYGAMFARRGNLWVVWLAHLLGDVAGLIVMSVV
jgi:membrane protease YdiL (CAAX protease family)